MNMYAYLNAVHSEVGPKDPRLARVLTVLWLHENRESGKCCPGTRKIATRARMDRKTVMAKLDDAEAAGWIRRTTRERGGPRGAYTEYELTTPSTEDKRSSPKVHRSPPDKRTSPEVDRSPESSGGISDAKRWNSEPKRWKNDAQADQSRDGPEQYEQEEQEQIEQPERAGAREAGRSTDERQQHISEGEHSADDMKRAAKAIAKPGRVEYHVGLMERDPEFLEVAIGLRWLCDTGEEFQRGEQFFALDKLLDSQPELRVRCVDAYRKMQGQARNGSGDPTHVEEIPPPGYTAEEWKAVAG